MSSATRVSPSSREPSSLLATGAGIGGVAGTILGGGGAAVVAGIDLVNTLNAPAGTTVWAQ
ncbi:hypothetical protein [Rhodococcus erythropolis]|uniref:hypothetical protein n=1 Tax=Rhodococcus erythropolis TaxID=1833 RepID=UPI002AD45352|nr:hypothetical protein [Rhodococcus erythropolis]